MKPILRATKLQLLTLILLGGVTLGLTQAFADNWPQWGHDQKHTGTSTAAGQNLNRILADIVYDPFVDQEKAPENGDGDLLVTTKLHWWMATMSLWSSSQAPTLPLPPGSLKHGMRKS